MQEGVEDSEAGVVGRSCRQESQAGVPGRSSRQEFQAGVQPAVAVEDGGG